MKNIFNKKTVKATRYQTEEQQEITRFIIILIVVIVCILGIYFFTKYVVKKPKLNISEDVKAGAINYEIVTVGTMLNKIDTEYYVLAYDNNNDNAASYAGIASQYQSKEKSLAIYHIDLSNELNKAYIASSENEVTKVPGKIENLKLGELTLLKIKNKKIEKIITSEEKIRKELNV